MGREDKEEMRVPTVAGMTESIIRLQRENQVLMDTIIKKRSVQVCMEGEDMTHKRMGHTIPKRTMMTKSRIQM
jgi:hypothetical protein